jgi:hypothetical protein
MKVDTWKGGTVQDLFTMANLCLIFVHLCSRIYQKTSNFKQHSIVMCCSLSELPTRDTSRVVGVSVVSQCQSVVAPTRHGKSTYIIITRLIISF